MFTAPRRVEIEERPLARPGPGEVLVETLYSTISPGTELLIYRGEAPSELAADPVLARLGSGDLGFPLTYGYSSVGRVIELGEGVEASWRDREVFAFEPHASHFVCPLSDVHPLPVEIDPGIAGLLPNLETAVSFVMDGAPILGERVVVFGQGVVGLLTTRLLGQLPLSRLVTVDRHPARRRYSQKLGAEISLDPDADGFAGDLTAALAGNDDPGGADLALELSGNPKALAQAIAATGDGGRVLIGSWYGRKPVELDLGGRFHRSGISLIASQVSRLAPRHRGRFSKRRRLETAWTHLRDGNLARLITHRLPFHEAAAAYRLLDERPQEAVVVVLEHPGKGLSSG